jgi:mRNA-degrading endonuclease HigB of HigAB toxin-antitoxin module
MHVIAAKTLRDYAARYVDASEWLLNFLERAEAGHWESIADIRRIYPYADAVLGSV